MSEPYMYYIDKRPGNTEHLIGVNWVYVWMLKNLSSWESIETWNMEESYGTLRPDAVVGIRNKVTKELRIQFVELDLATSGNKFEKVAKYNFFYTSEAYLGCWWEPLVKKFPSVLVVTTSPAKADFIRRKVKEENENEVVFRVMTLAEVAM